VRRMNVKALRCGAVHPRGRPLLGPQSDHGERSIVQAREFAEEAAMALRENAAAKKLDAGKFELPRATSESDQHVVVSDAIFEVIYKGVSTTPRAKPRRTH